MRSLTAALFCIATAGWAAPQPELEKAAAALTEGKAAAALTMLDAAAKVGRLDRENLVLLYQLRGMAHALDKKGEAKAKAAFQAMVWLQPEAGVPNSADASAFRALKAAKEWAKKEGPLEFRAEPAAVDDRGRVMQIAAYLKSDPLKLVRKVRFHVRANAGAWGEMLESVQSSYAATATEAEGVEWWAELLTDRDSVLAVIGSEEAPVLEGKAKAAKKPPPKVAKVEPKKEPGAKDAPVAERAEGEAVADKPVEQLQTGPPPRPFMTSARGLGIGLAAAGLVTFLIGTFCGAGSAGDRAQLDALPNDGSLVTSMTQKEAMALENSANGAATAANVLYVTSGLMAAGGVVLIIFGGPAEGPQVSLAPAGAGLVLSGTLP